MKEILRVFFYYNFKIQLSLQIKLVVRRCRINGSMSNHANRHRHSDCVLIN